MINVIWHAICCLIFSVLYSILYSNFHKALKTTERLLPNCFIETILGHVKLSKNNNFSLFPPILVGLETFSGNIKKPSNLTDVLHHVFYRKKLEMVLSQLQSLKFTKNWNNKKYKNCLKIIDFRPFSGGLETTEILKNHQIFQKCSSLCILSTEPNLRW